jgi:hypothetical protein
MQNGLATFLDGCMRWLIGLLVTLAGGGFVFFRLSVFDVTLLKIEKIELWGRYEVPPPGSVGPPSVNPSLSCTPGEKVQVSDTAVHQRFLGIQDGEPLQALMRSSAGNSQDRHTAILQAVAAETVKRLADTGTLTVTLSGVPFSQAVPNEVPFLAGDNICQQMVPLRRTPDGALVTNISITGGRLLSQASLVLPRAMLAGSPGIRMCVQPSFPLAYGRELTHNAHCDAPGSSLHRAASRGVSARTTLVVRR